MTASGGSFYGTGNVQAINGQIVTNVVLASADGPDHGQRRRPQAATCAWQPPTRLASTPRLLASVHSGDLAFVVSLAFNSLGWKSQNILFNLVDTILGEPLIAGALDGEEPRRLGHDRRLAPSTPTVT